MLTTLTSRETALLVGIMQDLTRIGDGTELRLRVGERLLDLLKADYFASYVWSADTGADTGRVSINMNPANLATYEQYYQFRDPITQQLRRRRRATHVNEILPQEDLARTEFFNDFLARDGLCHGMNFHAHDGPTHVGDIRIWRGRQGETFDRRDIEILDAVGQAFSNALCSIRSFERQLRAADPGRRVDEWAERFGLTARETDVVRLAVSGQRDADIAESLGISITTVRTHLGNVFQKSGIVGRAALAAEINGLKLN